METIAQEAFAATLAVSLKVIFVVVVVTLPIFLVKLFWKMWMQYVRADFFAKQKYILLECHLPKGVVKPPLAMEIVLASFFQTGGEATWIKRYWDGSVRPWFSLEMISIEGNIRFFIWARAGFKDMLMTQLYAQFPDIEIDDVTHEDYVDQIPFDLDRYKFWGCEFTKSEASHLPIKTYSKYGLTGATENEDAKIDPITPVIEYLGSLGKGEQAWVQVCIRAHKKEIPKKGTWFQKVDWKEAAAADLLKRTKRDIKVDKDKPINTSLITMTEGEKEAVKAIEDNLGKLPFDTGIRTIYAATKDAYKTSSQTGLLGIYKHFGTPNLNSFKPKGPGFDYPWEDFFGKKEKKNVKEFFDRYVCRSFFIKEYIPEGYDKDPFVMTSEEIATIYHYPGHVAKTPSLQRISAKKVEPPVNLPI